MNTRKLIPLGTIGALHSHVVRVLWQGEPAILPVYCESRDPAVAKELALRHGYEIDLNGEVDNGPSTAKVSALVMLKLGAELSDLDKADFLAAHDAVAELIEADKAYDDAMSRHYYALHYGPLDDQKSRIDRAGVKLREAVTRRDAALARIGVES